MANNPITSGHLYKDEGDLVQGIEQLKLFEKQYESFIATIKKEASGLEVTTKKLNGTTAQQRDEIKKSATQADKLETALNKYNEALDENSVKIEAIKNAQKELTAVNKLEAKVKASQGGSLNQLNAQLKLNQTRLHQMSDAQKANTVEGKKLVAQTERLSSKVKEVKDAERRAIKIKQLERKVVKEQIGSFNQLSAQYSLNKIRLNQMTVAERENTKEGKKMVTETKAIREEMKRLQEVTGVHTLSVGDYKNKTVEALETTGLFSAQMRIINQLKALYAIFTRKAAKAEAQQTATTVSATTATTAKAGATKGATAANKGFIKSLRFLRIALISTGIGAIVVVLGSLIAAFSSTQRGADAFTKVMRPLKAIMEVFLGVLQDISFGALDGFKSALSDPLGAIKNLGKSLQDSLINKMQQFGKLGAGFVKILKGDFKEGFLEMGKAISDISGLTLVANGIKKVGDKMSEAAKKGAQLDAMQKKIEKSQIALIVASEKLRNEYNKQKEVAADTSKSDGKRLKANKAAKVALEKLLDIQRQDIDLRIEQLKLEQSLNDTSREGQKELQELLAERIRFQTSSSKKRLSLISIEASIINKRRAAEKSAQLAEQKRLEKLAKDAAKFSAEKLAAEKELTAFLLGEAKNRTSDLVELQNIELEQLDISYLKKLEKLEKYGIDSRSLDQWVANQRLLIIQKRIATELELEAQAAIRKYANELAAFDLVQELRESEFDLIKHTEAEKEKFRLESEKARLEKILKLNKEHGEKLSIVELNTIQNIIEKIDNEINAIGGDEKRSLYDMLGLSVTDEQKKAFSDSLQFAKQQLFDFATQRTTLATQAVEQTNREAAAAQQALQIEIQKNAAGLASRVETAEKDFQAAQQSQQRALAAQKKAQRTERNLQTVQQAGNMVTASTKIWAQVGNPLIAIPLIALMWGSFIATKVRANQLAKKTYGKGGFEHINYGGSHTSGNDVDFGRTKDGRQRTVERNEGVAIFRKSSMKKYGKSTVEDITNSINDGTFFEDFQRTQSVAEVSDIPVFNYTDKTDTSKMEGYLSDISSASKNREYYDRDGNLVIIRGNHTTVEMRL